MSIEIVKLPVTRAGRANWALNLTPSDQFLRDVMETAVHHGCGYWASFKVVRYDRVQDGELNPDGSANFVGELSHVAVAEHDGDETPQDSKWISVNLCTLSKGVAKLLAGGMFDPEVPGHKPGSGDAATRYRADLFKAILDDDAGQVDAELADLVMQAAALGCIRYG